jgi:predicted phage terminase large subunit-like protein
MIEERQALAAAARLYFGLFLRFAVREVGGDGEFKHNWHIDAIIHQLERIRRGENTRLVINIPPRHLKSITASVAWVAWMLGHNPALRIICVSYGYELSEKMARDCLRLFETEIFKLAFPEFKLVKRSVLDFETSEGGGRLSTSVGGVLTGRGAHIILIDDPLKADDALSESARNLARDWMFGTLMSRLDDQEKSAIIVIQQRLHENDLAGELLRRGGWHELRLPAIAQEDEKIPIGHDCFYQRRAGCALHPARQPLRVLERIRAEDSRVFAAQYLQSPVPALGNFVEPYWLKYYDEPPDGGIRVLSLDTASKTGVTSDFSVGIVATYYQRRYYILDVFRERVDFVRLRASVIRLCRDYRINRLLIEDAASGMQLLQMLRHQCPEGVPLPIACRPEGDKVSRFAAQASRFEAGEVVLPRAAPWLADLITEIIGFPNAPHDDQADAMSQMLAHSPREPLLGLAGPRLHPPLD